MSHVSSNPLVSLLEETLFNNKAFDVVVMNVTELSSFTDFLVIASATSSRHAKAVAEHCIDAAKEAHFSNFSTQGEDLGEWILVDFGDVILHIMQPEVRAYYQLEKLWDYNSSQLVKNSQHG